MALITAAEARIALKALGAATDQDTDLDTLIGRADAVLAKHLGWPAVWDGAAASYSLEEQSYTLFFDGPDYDASDRLTLGVLNVTSVTSVHVDTLRDYGAATLQDSADRDVDQPRGIIYLRPDASTVFERGRRAIKVVATAGWSTAPNDLKEATALLVAHWAVLGGSRLGVQSLSHADTSTTYRRETLPASVVQLVEQYRVGGWLG